MLAIKEIENTNMIVVLKLALKSNKKDRFGNSIITMYTVRKTEIRRLVKKNKKLFDKLTKKE